LIASIRAGLILLTFIVVSVVCMPWQESALRFALKRRKTFPNRFHRFVARLFGIRIRVVGKPVQGAGVLMIANHTSWLDIIILSAAARLNFIAKAEVSSWPFFGTLARLQETVYVQRARRSETGQARDQIRERLLAGDALVLFAEGTSSDGNTVLPFKSALMGAAEARLGSDQHPVPVQPVSVSYVGLHGIPMGRENRPLFAWYGDMDLVPHLWEALKAGPLDVVVEFHPTLDVVSAGGRKNLAEMVEKIVREGQVRALNNFVPAEA
jgi:1-acyl-sn-glycerol-3-phosphate acyltransferase